eukprot:1092306-Lingulodinium_polyedra.AAC.1
MDYCVQAQGRHPTCGVSLSIMPQMHRDCDVLSKVECGKSWAHTASMLGLSQGLALGTCGGLRQL